MLDPFLIETIKNPFSFPFLLICYFLTLLIVISRLVLEIINNFKSNYKSSYKAISILLILYLSSTLLVFYNANTMPKAGFETDDGIYAIGASILQRTARDNTSFTTLPYFPYVQAKYHEEAAWAVSLRPLPAYCQTFLLYFAPPGFRGIKLATALFTFFSSIVLIFTFLLLTENLNFSILCGAMFNFLPWSNFLANLHPEGSAYMFGSALFIFAFFYFLKKSTFFGFILYILSILMYICSWAPAFIAAPLSAIVLPLALSLYSRKERAKHLFLLFAGITVISIFYYHIKDEPGFIWNTGRPGSLGCLSGLSPFNLSEIIRGLKLNWNLYLANFIGYLLPQFLFISGDSNLRHNSGFGGELFISLSVAFYLGLFYIIFDKTNINLKLLLIYLLISIVPYSICTASELNVDLKLPLHAMKQAAMVAPLALIIMIGLLNISKANKALFLIYIIIIIINAGMFYNHYFNTYPKILGKTWFNDPGLQIASRKAYKMLEKNRSKKVFYVAPPTTFTYHNLDRIKTEDLVNGTGILSNIYEYNRNPLIKPEVGDIILAQEEFNYESLNMNYKFITRVNNKYLPNNAIGTSLIEIISNPSK